MPPGIKSVGQTIWLQRQNRRARYKVAWIGQEGTSLHGQVGVESSGTRQCDLGAGNQSPYHAFLVRSTFQTLLL